ncbi:MAG TPA: hypothetical protein VEL09_05045 [Burkholderiales bacterium]|nr:hypothetical protein [Burkholderiales bacterium]
MDRLTRGTLLVAAIMLLAAMPARAQIVNGSFEDDPAYVGWTLEESPAGDPCAGTWGIAASGFTLLPGGVAFDFHDMVSCPQSSFGLSPTGITFTATDGLKLAFQLQNGPQFHRMFQDIAVGPASTLQWDMQYRNHAGVFHPVNQYLAVRIRDLSDAILQTLFITNPGDPQSIPMTHFSADLAAFAGSTVRLSIDMQTDLLFLDAQFDNFMLAGNCAAPVIASLTATPSVIWPPNHKMVPVTVSADASAACGPPVCRIVAIASDEPSNGRGDGNTSIDAHIVPPLTAEIRAERAGGGFLGRTYTITVECTDTAGNTTRKDTTVFVPHDQRK